MAAEELSFSAWEERRELQCDGWDEEGPSPLPRQEGARRGDLR